MRYPLEQSDAPLFEKLGHLLNRIQVVMRADSWDSLGASGLNPTQGQILRVLGRYEQALRLGDIAEQLAVSPPTVSDSVGTLVKKGLVKKSRAKDDGRAVAVKLTSAGKRFTGRLDATDESVSAAIGRLPDAEQVQLYRTLLRVVRELQRDGQIHVDRMCVTCRYFQPNVHADRKRPHHCGLVDSAFGDRTLRADCPDHELADEQLARKNWNTLVGVRS